jgi:hypothetical protein
MAKSRMSEGIYEQLRDAIAKRGGRYPEVDIPERSRGNFTLRRRPR